MTSNINANGTVVILDLTPVYDSLRSSMAQSYRGNGISNSGLDNSYLEETCDLIVGSLIVSIFQYVSKNLRMPIYSETGQFADSVTTLASGLLDIFLSMEIAVEAINRAEQEMLSCILANIPDIDSFIIDDYVFNNKAIYIKVNRP